MAVTSGVDRNTADKVKIAVAIHIKQLAAPAIIDHQPMFAAMRRRDHPFIARQNRLRLWPRRIKSLYRWPL